MLDKEVGLGGRGMLQIPRPHAPHAPHALPCPPLPSACCSRSSPGMGRLGLRLALLCASCRILTPRCHPVKWG